MAKERKIRRKQSASKSGKLSPAQEIRKIEKLLGEDFDNLAEARRALKRESIPTKKSAPKSHPKSAPPKSAPQPSRFNAKKASRKEKFFHAQKIGKAKYTRILREWWDDHPDDDPADNPYCYHSKE